MARKTTNDRDMDVISSKLNSSVANANPSDIEVATRYLNSPLPRNNEIEKSAIMENNKYQLCGVGSTLTSVNLLWVPARIAKKMESETGTCRSTMPAAINPHVVAVAMDTRMRCVLADGLAHVTASIM
jgi:hypothetical protein